MPQPENIVGKGFDNFPENINKKGRPKGFKGFTATLLDILNEDGTMTVENIIEVEEIINADGTKYKKETGRIIPFGKIKIPKGEMILLAAFKQAMKGNMRAIEYMNNRTEGMASQKIEQTITREKEVYKLPDGTVITF